MSQHSTKDGLLLPGLDGTNPLGFLAALGVLRVLSVREQSVKLSWRLAGGSWRAELLGVETSLLDLGTKLYDLIQGIDKTAWSIDKELPFQATRLREHGQNSISSGSQSNRMKIDTISALGVESFREIKDVKKVKTEIFKDTVFRLVRSGDNKHNGLLEYAASTLNVCNAEMIQKSIASDWLYADEKKSFRWDPAEDRGYALQWSNPSGDGALTERGANCLALFGMTCFPVIPVKGQVETTGFGLKKSKQIALTWPIWKHPINFSIARSLLTLSELQHEQPDRLKLDSLGIAAAYRCQRVMTSTYYANFTPSQRVG